MTISVSSLAVACTNPARTPLEDIYCQIKAKDGSITLPSFHEFQQNPVKTQRLLLRRPAQKLGIPLPPPVQLEPAKPVHNQKHSEQESAATAISPLSECKLDQQFIKCAGSHYVLVGNLANDRLATNALSATVLHINLPHSSASEDSLQATMLANYGHYVNAMMTIGLGGSTMSYTKFFLTYKESLSNGANFAKRMTTMFEFLKRDKVNMAVQPQFNTKLPNNIEQCDALSSDLIVCDNVQQNWLYKKR